MKFLVYHNYDVDGGFGDAIPKKELIGILNVTYVKDPVEAAEEWAKRNTHDHIYDCPYACLHEGIISVEPMKLKEFSLNDEVWTEEEKAYLDDPRTDMEIQRDEYEAEMAARMDEDPEFQQYLEDCEDAECP